MMVIKLRMLSIVI